VTAGLLARLVEDPQLTYQSVSDGLNLGQALAALSCAFVGARGMNSILTWGEASRYLERPSAADWANAEDAKQSVPARTPLSAHGCAACGSRRLTSTSRKARP
jgi:fructokinase